jgi:hypothetical protein
MLTAVGTSDVYEDVRRWLWEALLSKLREAEMPDVIQLPPRPDPNCACRKCRAWVARNAS